MEFGKLGCAVIHADLIAHQVLQRSDILDKLVEEFGPAVLDADGKIDRNKAAGIAFSDPSKVAVLNRIVHPHVLDIVQRLVDYYQAHTDVPALVLDMPLLLEVGWADRCDRLVFVACDPATRLARTGTLTEEQVRTREKFQISVDKKAAVADNTIENNSDFSALVRQTATIFSSVVKQVGGLQS